MNGGTITFKFTGDDKELEKKTSQLNTKLGSLAKTAGKTLAIGLATATAGLGALVKKSVDAYANFEQLEGGLVSVFGEGSDEMNKILATSEQAYKDLTMSQNDYLTSFQSAYPLINNGLSENADALEYTNKVLQLESDLFNTYGGSTEQYATAINWALKGTFSYVDNLNLGIKGTAEGFVEAANASGILGREVKNVNELTSDEIVDVISHYAEQYGVLGKTAQEAGSTIQGSMNMMKASWTDLVSSFAKGKDIDKAFKNFLKSAKTFAKNIMPVIKTALESILEMIPEIAPDLVNVIQEVILMITNVLPDLIKTLLPAVIDGVIAILNGLIQMLPQIIQILANMIPIIIPQLIQGAVQIINALAEQMPVIIPILITAIIDGILSILDNIDLLIECGMQLLIGIVEGVMKATPQLIAKMPEIIGAFIKAGIKSWGMLFKYGGELLGKIKDGITNAIGKMADVGKNIVKGLWNGIKNAKDWLMNKIKGFGNSVLNGIKGVFGIHSPSTLMRDVIGKNLALGIGVGFEDETPDVIDEMQKSLNAMISPNAIGTMNASSSSKVQVDVYNNMEIDPIGQVVSNIKTFSGGAKNDYNYGAGA